MCFDEAPEAIRDLAMVRRDDRGVRYRQAKRPSELDELRAQIALKYLRTTELANEEIALALGFSDATNFRRAFRRWTNRTPSEIRRTPGARARSFRA